MRALSVSEQAARVAGLVARPRLSVVSTLYGSEGTVEAFVRSHVEAARRLVGEAHEVILVNDGSPDGSLAIAKALTGTYPTLCVIDLSRNFGHHKALLAGVEAARGDRVYICDSDMEEPPEWLEAFWERMDAGGGALDLVGGVQERRVRGLKDRVLAGGSWRLLAALSKTELRPNLVTARLMSRAYAAALVSYAEREVFLATLCSDVGFAQAFLPVEKVAEAPTTYTLTKKIRLLIDGITAFSVVPLYLSAVLAGLLALLGGGALLFTLASWLRTETLPGWASQMGLMSLCFAALFGVLAIQGVYLGRVFTEVRARPRTIVRDVTKGSAL